MIEVPFPERIHVDAVSNITPTQNRENEAVEPSEIRYRRFVISRQLPDGKFEALYVMLLTCERRC